MYVSLTRARICCIETPRKSTRPERVSRAEPHTHTHSFVYNTLTQVPTHTATQKDGGWLPENSSLHAQQPNVHICDFIMPQTSAYTHTTSSTYSKCTRTFIDVFPGTAPRRTHVRFEAHARGRDDDAAVDHPKSTPRAIHIHAHTATGRAVSRTGCMCRCQTRPRALRMHLRAGGQMLGPNQRAQLAKTN